MPRRLATRIGGIVIVVVASFMAACADGGSRDADPWGGEAVEYFDELSSAYTANDYYGVLDFYGVEAFVEIFRGDIEGGMLVRNYLIWNSGDLGNTVRETYVGRKAALTFVEWETSHGLSVIYDDIAEGVITHEVVYDHGAWLEQGLRSTQEHVAVYENLYESFAETWIDTTPSLADLYHPDVVLSDPGIDEDIHGIEGLETTRGWAEDIEVVSVSSDTVTGPRAGPAVFQGPAGLGTDPERAVGLFEVTTSGGCVDELAVVWRLQDGLVVEEVRLWGAGAFDGCGRTGPRGWWSDLELPGHSDERVTGVVEGADGDQIVVHNGTAELEALVTAGLERFSRAGLGEPHFDSVTFEPSRNCETRSGRLLQGEGSRDLFLCLYESDLCPTTSECSEPPLNVRSNVLHELGHAWILDNVDAGEQADFLAVAGLDTWEGTDVPWPERGVEYAAEVIAWGLLEETAPMVRIGRPSCEQLAEAFDALTQGTSPFRAGACSGA